MTITTTTKSRSELTERRDELLQGLGLTLEQLTARRRDGSLTADEWSAWEEIAEISYLLG